MVRGVMKHHLVLLLAVLLLAPRPSLAAAPPVKVIFDTDMAGDVDDVGALAILHAMADLGEAEILAVGISSRNEDVGPVVDAINTWYGRPDIPDRLPARHPGRLPGGHGRDDHVEIRGGGAPVVPTSPRS